MKGSGRNVELARGVPAYSRSRVSRMKQQYKFSKNEKVKAAAAPVEDETKTLVKSRFYSADDVARPLKSRKSTRRVTRLKAGLRPGSVLILLAGRFRGKRVVFLKQLESGLLLVTGPYKVNGVPLRRVNQAYVIVTSTVVDVDGVDVSKVDDAFFAYQRKSKQQKDEFFQEDDKKKNVISEERKQMQVSVDTALLEKVAAVPFLKAYLNARFSLKRGQFPHEIKF